MTGSGPRPDFTRGAPRSRQDPPDHLPRARRQLARTRRKPGAPERPGLAIADRANPPTDIGGERRIARPRHDRLDRRLSGTTPLGSAVLQFPGREPTAASGQGATRIESALSPRQGMQKIS
jgi:hypothetical protein